jgi:hypothetical protein
MILPNELTFETAFLVQHTIAAENISGCNIVISGLPDKSRRSIVTFRKLTSSDIIGSDSTIAGSGF